MIDNHAYIYSHHLNGLRINMQASPLIFLSLSRFIVFFFWWFNDLGHINACVCASRHIDINLNQRLLLNCLYPSYLRQRWAIAVRPMSLFMRTYVSRSQQFNIRCDYLLDIGWEGWINIYVIPWNFLSWKDINSDDYYL